MRKTIFGMLLIAIGCTNTNTDKQIEQKNTQADTVQSASQASADTAITKHKRDTVKGVLYEYKNDTLLQILSIKYILKQEIEFELTSVNKTKNKTSTLKGTATGNLNQDPEIDEDDEGNSYAATEYHYNKEACSIGIRVAIEGTKDKAKIFEYDCSKLHDINCPFASVGVLKKVQK